MKYLAILGLFFAVSAQADFFDEQASIFRNQNLCDSRNADQAQADQNYRKLLATLSADEENGRTSKVTLEIASVYSTVLKNQSTGQECGIIVHDHCYSAYCE